jgi:Ran GTPase-activating protein (RanGAP) involved in mRNA processing and transport
VLAQCEALAHLDLRSNEIGSGGARRLAEVQAQCPALVHLYLSDNRLQDHEAGRFAGVLAQAERWLASVYYPD